MKNIWFSIFIICTFLSSAYAFSNSLDGSAQQNLGQTYNSNSNQFQQRYQTQSNTPYNPKTYSGYEHQNKQFPEATMNSTRYNSNCQFGNCIPGGFKK